MLYRCCVMLCTVLVQVWMLQTMICLLYVYCYVIMLYCLKVYIRCSRVTFHWKSWVHGFIVPDYAVFVLHVCKIIPMVDFRVLWNFIVVLRNSILAFMKQLVFLNLFYPTGRACVQYLVWHAVDGSEGSLHCPSAPVALLSILYFSLIPFCIFTLSCINSSTVHWSIWII